MYQLIIAIHVLLGLGIIGLVLMQQGRGADAGAAFGSGASGSVFGARGAASFLSRTTAIFATLFFITSLLLAYLSGKTGQTTDIMQDVKTEIAPKASSDMPAVPGVDQAAKAVAGAANQVANNAAQVAGQAADVSKSATDAAAQVANNATEVAGQAASTVQSAADAASQAAVNAAQTATDATAQAVNNASQVATETANQAANAVQSATDTATQAAADAAKTASDVTGQAADAAKSTAEAVGDAAKGAADMATQAVDAAKNTAAAFEDTLSTGFALKAAKDGIESKLVSFIKDSGSAVSKDQWFTMDGITFDNGKSTVKDQSKAQLTNIAEITKAFPAVKIKIGGYTDNAGKADFNKKLSNDRAIAIKKALIGLGVNAGRISAEGYGSEHPVASNDNDAGRQQNRRIDINVVAK